MHNKLNWNAFAKPTLDAMVQLSQSLPEAVSEARNLQSFQKFALDDEDFASPLAVQKFLIDTAKEMQSKWGSPYN